ncbi:MAG TPA: hypothetical protein VF003_10540 [Pseudonocardiaceae bacterium]
MLLACGDVANWDRRTRHPARRGVVGAARLTKVATSSATTLLSCRGGGLGGAAGQLGVLAARGYPATAAWLPTDAVHQLAHAVSAAEPVREYRSTAAW